MYVATSIAIYFTEAKDMLIHVSCYIYSYNN